MNHKSKRSVSCPGISVSSEWLVLNIIPIQSSAPKIDYMSVFIKSQFVSQPQTYIFSRKEFHVHSGEVLSSHDVVKGISTSGTLTRFFRQSHIHHLLFQLVSQRNVRLLPRHTQKHPHQDFWRSEVHVRRLRIRIVRQCVFCVHKTVLGRCLLVRVFFFTDSRGSTLYIFVYILVA